MRSAPTESPLKKKKNEKKNRRKKRRKKRIKAKRSGEKQREKPVRLLESLSDKRGWNRNGFLVVTFIRKLETF